MIWSKKNKTGSVPNKRKKQNEKQREKQARQQSAKHQDGRASKVHSSSSRDLILKLAPLLASLKSLVGLTVIVVLGLVLTRALYSFLNTPIENVRLYAELDRVTALEVESVLSQYRRTGFLDLDLDSLSNELQAIAWVDRAEVRRQWPSGLVVTLVEQIAVARWGDKDLLNSRGERILKDLELPHLPPELPLLDGPEGSEWRVAQRYLDLYNLVNSHGLYIKELHQDERGTWEFTLSNGTKVKLGKHRTAERLARFANYILPDILQQNQHPEILDMRYSNGFAVQWQELKPPIVNDSLQQSQAKETVNKNG